MIAHFLERAFTVNLLLQPAQCLVHRLAFFKSNFGQKISLPSRVLHRTDMARAIKWSFTMRGTRAPVNRQKRKHFGGRKKLARAFPALNFGAAPASLAS